MKIKLSSVQIIAAGLIIFFTLRVQRIIAQTTVTTIRGIVHDATDQPVIGASIVIQDTKTKFITRSLSNEAGAFSGKAPAGGPYTITITSVGFESQTLAGYYLKDNSTVSLDIMMRPSIGSLQSVVVVGYGTQRKVNLTGAVEMVSGAAVTNRPTPTLSQALQGKVSSVNFTTGVYGFEPGASLNLQVRGQGTPLILVDGLAVNSLDGINPNDIATVSILKDAAASAIYGARAPYGVILITTKNGDKNGRLAISYNGLYTRIKPLHMPHHLDSYTTALAFNEAADNTGITHPFSNATIDRILTYKKDPKHTPETIPNPTNPTLWGDTFMGNADYDWYNVFFGSATRQQHNISLSAGNNGISFYASGGYEHDPGMLKYGTDTYKRYTFTSKINADPAKWLRFIANTRFYNTNRITPAMDNQGNYDLLFHQVARTLPSQPMKSPNGVYRIESKIPWVNDAGTNGTAINDIVQQFAVQVTPVANWTINGDYGIDFTNTAFDSKNFTVYEDNVAGKPIMSGSTQNAGIAKSRNQTIYQSFNIYSTYRLKLATSHNLSIMGGFQQELSTNDYIYAKRNGLLTGAIPTISASTGEQFGADSLGKYATEGFFGRFRYNYAHKYLFELNARYDGTYKFTDGKKWGLFPSASAAWIVSQEKFWSRLKGVVNSLKIRGSYGSLGNQLTATPYQDIPLLTANPNLNWIVNGARPSYVTAPGLINPAITWEKVNSADIGLDITFLDDRLNFSGDIYQKRTKNQLGPQAAVPATIGVSALPQANNAETKTNGWEFTISWKDKPGKNFSYSISGMLFNYKSVITKYNNPTKTLTTSYAGQQLGELWGLVSKGLITDQKTADAINQNKTQQAVSALNWNTGDMQYADLDGDGKISYGNNTVYNPGDRRIIGNTTPQYQFGCTINAQWKGIELNMFWQGVGRRDVNVGYSSTINGNMMWGFTTANQSSLFKAHLDYYRDEAPDKYSGLGVNKDAYYARPYLTAEANAKNQAQQTRYLLNGAYARLKNLQLGYHLPSQALKRIKLQGLYIYASGENLVTFDHLPAHLDPETATVGLRGNGKSYFPATGYSVGINLTL